MEQFKQIQDSDYQISNKGRVISLKANDAKALSVYPDKDGYRVITLNIGGKEKQFKVHRLVGEYFIDKYGLPENANEINHIDGVKDNNDVSNLEWVTRAQNIAHAKANGLFRTGESHPAAKLKESDVVFILNNRENIPAKDMASMFKVGETTIRQILRGEKWKHLSNKQ